MYVVLFLFAVFFVPFVVITASYLVVTIRIWSFSNYSGGAATGGHAGETSSRETGCPGCEGDAEDEDYEVHTMETGAEYEMKVLRVDSSTSTNNDCHDCHVNSQV